MTDSDSGKQPAAAAELAAQPEERPANTLAVVGIVLTLIAAMMAGLLITMAGRLAETEAASATDSPSTVAGSEQRAAESGSTGEFDAAVRLRILLLASTTAVVCLTGLSLCTAGLLTADRPRALAVTGVVVSLLILAGLFGVMITGSLLNPLPPGR